MNTRLEQHPNQDQRDHFYNVFGECHLSATVFCFISFKAWQKRDLANTCLHQFLAIWHEYRFIIYCQVFLHSYNIPIIWIRNAYNKIVTRLL